MFISTQMLFYSNPERTNQTQFLDLWVFCWVFGIGHHGFSTRFWEKFKLVAICSPYH